MEPTAERTLGIVLRGSGKQRSPKGQIERRRWSRQRAHLLWAAWRAKQVVRGTSTKRAVGQHVARFILVGIYSGTRSSAICGAALMPTVGRGYVDLERGVFYRRAIGRRQTRKRQTPVRLSPRLLAHLRPLEAAQIVKKGGRRMEWRGRRKCTQGFRVGRPGCESESKNHSTHPSSHLCDLANAARRRSMGRRWFPRHDDEAARSHVRSPSPRLPVRGSRSFGGPEWGTKPREQKATEGGERHENRRIFKGRVAIRLVRDEGVAGSNPATPTSRPPKALISRICLQMLTIYNDA